MLPRNEVKKKIIDVFEFNGYFIPNNIENDADIDLTTYDISSIEFINIIVSLEEEFGIYIPDENLTLDLFKSFNGLVEFISNLT